MKWPICELAVTTVVLLFVQGAYATAQLSLGSAHTLASSAVELDLKLNAAESACAGVNAKVILPPGVSLVGIEKGGLLSGGDFAFDYHAFSGGVTVIAYSRQDTFRGSDGVLLRLRLAVAADVVPGKYPVRFAESNPNIGVNSRYALSDATGEHSLPVTATDGELTVDSDGDHDGMGDTWEWSQFGNLLRDGNGDSDNDGVIDRDEFLGGTDAKTRDTDGDGLGDAEEGVAGTSPTDPGDSFAITDVQMVAANGPFALYWDSKPDRTYTVYAAESADGVWTAVFEVGGDGTQKVYTSSEAATYRFFRLAVEAMP